VVVVSALVSSPVRRCLFQHCCEVVHENYPVYFQTTPFSMLSSAVDSGAVDDVVAVFALH